MEHTKKITSGATVAQMVCDALRNEPRAENNVLTRAKIWYVRAVKLSESNKMYYKTALDDKFEGFLCYIESNLGILDFWDGDVVEYEQQDSDGNRVVKTGVVKSIAVDATIYGGGHATVVLCDGSVVSKDWKELWHSSIPQSILDVAKAQMLASSKCPFME